jgi:hypothetical protein
MSQLPRQTLDAALADLHTRDEFKVVLQFIKEERELLIKDLGVCENPNEVMKFSGGIARLDELVTALSPP